MSYINKKMPVAIDRCEKYDYKDIENILKNQIAHLTLDRQFFQDKNIVIKPNLLMKATPDKSITTHPVMIEAMINVLKEYSPRTITIAESPGGPYNQVSLNMIYKSTGMTSVSEKTGVPLNFDTSAVNVSNPSGHVCKVFNIISPIVNADIIINMCKLKTHSLTTMSASIKNLFGTIPGIEKFEMHTRYKEPSDFEKMLVDLCYMHTQDKPVLSVVDAIFGMEGDGPSGGDVRNFGLILSSLNPFNLDVVCSSVLGLERNVGYINEAIRRGYAKDYTEKNDLIDGEIKNYRFSDVKLPRTKSLFWFKKLPTIFGGRLNKFFEPRPSIIKNKCIGCGECIRSCPAKTISFSVNKNGRKIAEINYNKCIKCYCCQELCPINSIKIKKNPVFRIIR